MIDTVTVIFGIGIYTVSQTIRGSFHTRIKTAHETVIKKQLIAKSMKGTHFFEKLVIQSFRSGTLKLPRTKLQLPKFLKIEKKFHHCLKNDLKTNELATANENSTDSLFSLSLSTQWWNRIRTVHLVLLSDSTGTKKSLCVLNVYSNKP